MDLYPNLLLWLLIGLVLGVVIYLLLTPSVPLANQSETIPNQTLENITTQKQPVTLVVLNAPCEDCNYANASIQQVISFLSNSSNISLSEVKIFDYPSDDAELLIEKYNITELPCLVVVGNQGADQRLASIWVQNVGTNELDGTLVSRNVYPPYYNLSEQKAYGLIKAVVIHASNCDSCIDADEYLTSLEDISVGFVFVNKTVLYENDSLAQTYIEAYNITKLPVLILDDGFLAYPIASNILALGNIEQDGWFVLRDIRPPYEEIPSRQIRGLVDAIYLSNGSCADCFNPSDLGHYLAESAAVVLNNETSYDVSSTEGQALVEKYNLSHVPAVLFSPEMSIYQSFAFAWTNTNNTIESDGWFVFRNYDLINQTYQNITSG